MIDYLELACTCPDPLDEGFSAYKSTALASASTQIAGWSVTAPYFNSGNFNAISGNYTVPETGLYSMEATINYSTATIGVTIPSGIDPYFLIKRSYPTETELVSGLLPMLDIDISLLEVRAVLGNGTVTLAGEVYLAKDNIVGLYYDAAGMTESLTIKKVVWSVYRLI